MSARRTHALLALISGLCWLALVGARAHGATGSAIQCSIHLPGGVTSPLGTPLPDDHCLLPNGDLYDAQGHLILRTSRSTLAKTIQRLGPVGAGEAPSSLVVAPYKREAHGARAAAFAGTRLPNGQCILMNGDIYSARGRLVAGPAAVRTP